MVGLVGGYGWILKMNEGAPRKIQIDAVEVLKETPLLISVAYPSGTSFTITAKSPEWCNRDSTWVSCDEEFSPTTSIEAVRNGPGNQYYVDSDGVLTFRVSQTPQNYVPDPWYILDKDDPDITGFERDGVYLPQRAWGNYLLIEADCNDDGAGAFCSGGVSDYDPDVCPAGYEQMSYDYCCSSSSDCVFANSV